MSKKNTFEAKDFALRLAMLREARKISACAMSHELGHNRNYINGIELQKYFPSLTEFFEICNYLGISPGDFFSPQKEETPALGRATPAQLTPLALLCDELTPQQANIVYQMLCVFLR